jgi:BirA family biotin operon repressor/biotin-[acetyl-CoA-carboxylase] ligase
MSKALKLSHDCKLVMLEAVGSTNDYAKTLARNGCPSDTVVWAREQTAGRGRQGNAWISLSGNLFMTLILRPELSAALMGQLSFLAAVALARTLRPLLGKDADIRVKWPNDLLIEGKKAAGILLETELNGMLPVSWIVIGIGVNITDAPEGAVSLRALGIKEITAEDILEQLVFHVMTLYREWQKSGFSAVRDEWLECAYNIGSVINVRLPKETFSGTFLGIDHSGALQLKMPDGSKKIITSGEVFIR